MRLLRTLDRFLLLGLLTLNVLIIGLDSMQFSYYHTRTVIDIDLFREQHLKKIRAAYYDGCVFGVEYFSDMGTMPNKGGLMAYCDEKVKQREDDFIRGLVELGKK